jgi:hypothetical protein
MTVRCVQNTRLSNYVFSYPLPNPTLELAIFATCAYDYA